MLVGTGLGTGKASGVGLHGNGAAPMAGVREEQAKGQVKAPSGVLVGVSPLEIRPVDTAEMAGTAERMELLHVLVVDDDDAVRKACCTIAAGMGFAVVGADSATSARAILKHQKIDLILLDLKLPGGGGLGLLEQVKALHPETSVVVMTAFASVSSAVEAMRIGAGDYLTKPFALEELTTVLERSSQRHQMDVQSRQLRERLRTQKGLGGLIGQSPEMEKLPDSVEGGLLDASGFDPGREWRRQGAGGAVDPYEWAECGEAVCAGGLWVAGAYAD